MNIGCVEDGDRQCQPPKWNVVGLPRGWAFSVYYVFNYMLDDDDGLL